MNPFELEREYRETLIALHRVSKELLEMYKDDEAMREEQEKIRDYCKEQLGKRGVVV